jgi:hypothetical protein
MCEHKWLNAPKNSNVRLITADLFRSGWYYVSWCPNCGALRIGATVYHPRQVCCTQLQERSNHDCHLGIIGGTR